MFYTDSTFKKVLAHEQYVSPNGDQYCPKFPKNKIPGLYPVTEVPKPTDPLKVVIDYKIDFVGNKYTEVWTTRNKTADELANDLASAKVKQITYLYKEFKLAKNADINYAGHDFQADDTSIGYIHDMLATYPVSTPNDFYWVASDNTKVAFTRTDLVSLANAIGARGWSNFKHLQDLKEQVRTSNTIASVEAILW